MTVQYSNGGPVHEGHLVEISESGLRLTVSEPLATGVRLKLWVPVPAGGGGRRHMCLLTGEVVWCEGGSAGVRFVNPPIDSLLELRKSLGKAPAEGK